MNVVLVILIVYAVIVTVTLVAIIKVLKSRTLTTFDYNNVILKKTSSLYFDLNGFLMSDRDISNNGHILSSLLPGDHISKYEKRKDLNTYLKTCIKHRGNVTLKIEEVIENGIVKRIDLIFTPLICGGRMNGVIVISQEMYSKNREAELIEKTRALVSNNELAQRRIVELDAEREELESAFKKSSKHHIKLQKAMFRIEQQKAELEDAIEIINKQKEELETVNIEIRKSNQMKETFLANTSHEIRTPLNAIIGFTNLLLKMNPNEAQLKYLNNIKISGNNLLFIINDILDMSKIEAGKMDLESTNFRVRDLVHNCVDAVSVKREDKDINISINIDDDVPEVVVGDPFRINQVLTNLLNNSIKFTDRNCIITLSINLLRIGKNDVELKFTVSDNGIGIPKDKQAEVFQSFTQANKDTTRKYGGTGLGLSITKQLVEMYGGKITVESEPGYGSSFIFNLILKKATGEAVVSRKEPAVEAIDAPLKILLVEDNDINQQLAIDTLMAWNSNMKIDVANNGQIAVDKVKSGSYDLVLMDIQMPVMDGNSASRAIRSLEYPKCDVPIIAMTAHAFKEEQDRCLSNGMNDYVMKPFDPDDLCAKICKYTGMTQPGQNKELSDESPHFSLEKLIDTCSGNYDEVKRVVEVYERNVPADIDSLLLAYQDKNQEQVKLKLHSLSITFNYLGMPVVADLVEGLAKIMAEDDADVSIPISRITEEWEYTIPLIKEWVRTLKRDK